jgi:hypothetical protein
MGFFKKLGSAVKKGVKQISLKNVVKVGTPLLSMIPVVGGLAENLVSGMSAAHQKKKDAQAAAAAGKIEEANALNVQADYLATLSGAQVGQQVGSNFNAFTKGVTNETIAQTSKGFKDNTGLVGAEMVDNTIAQWLKLHWQIVALAVGGIVGLLFFFKRSGHNSNHRSIR